ncbi:MAG: hypothetical protein MJA31_13530 [Clostridia bacterium]|nr:hypothetical protein [Clostridia bacterium]
MNKKKSLLLTLCILCLIVLGYLLWLHSSLKGHQKIYFSNKTYTFTYKVDEIIFYYQGGKEKISLKKNKIIKDLSIGDIDGDKEDEILILSGSEDSNYGEELMIYKPEYIQDTIEMKPIYTNNLTTIHPFMIKTCDVDGDNALEIFIGVNKETPYYPKAENRPFFFNFVNGKLVKKWTGSKVRYPFIDACFVDFEGKGRDFFAVLETDEAGHRVALYYWLGFGFTLLGESEVYEKISDIGTVNIDGKEYIKTTLYKNGIKKERLLQLTNKKNQNDLMVLEERGF